MSQRFPTKIWSVTLPTTLIGRNYLDRDFFTQKCFNYNLCSSPYRANCRLFSSIFYPHKPKSFPFPVTLENANSSTITRPLTRDRRFNLHLTHFALGHDRNNNDDDDDEDDDGGGSMEIGERTA